MEEQIRQAFDQVRAGEELKDSARQYVQAHRQRHSPVRVRRSLAAAAAGFLLVLLTGGAISSGTSGVRGGGGRGLGSGAEP